MSETDIIGKSSPDGQVNEVERNLLAAFSDRLATVEFRWVDADSGYEVTRRYEFAPAAGGGE
ncbi:hypothetical protein [Leisingera caerulea]|uniref:hypothetical protein n=1 Tax=Leisingera caerulea TaxID=506591 RepID=UPI0012B67782|nr:hypothetical protein [Leisingera caerulea]